MKIIENVVWFRSFIMLFWAYLYEDSAEDLSLVYVNGSRF